VPVFQFGTGDRLSGGGRDNAAVPRLDLVAGGGPAVLADRFDVSFVDEDGEQRRQLTDAWSVPFETCLPVRGFPSYKRSDLDQAPMAVRQRVVAGARRSPRRCRRIPPRSRLTSRLRTSVGEAVADRGRTVVQAARDFKVSWPWRNTVDGRGRGCAAEEHAAGDAPGIDENRPREGEVPPGRGADGGEVWEVVAEVHK